MYKRKKIVFIVDDYLPKYSAVGGCVKNLVDELAIDNEIIVIAKSQSTKTENIDLFNCKIRYFDTSYNFIRNKVQEKQKTNRKLQKIIMDVFLFLLRSYGYFLALIKDVNIKNDEVESIFTALVNEGEIDLIIPTCLPIESILAALKFKSEVYSQTKVVPYLFDKFSDNKTLHRSNSNRVRKFTRHVNLEKYIFKECDRVFYVESWGAHISKYFPEIEDKFVLVDHPLIKKNIPEITNEFDANSVNIVYTGALYRKLRSPKIALSLFEKLILLNRKVVLHFYITGDCFKTVKNYSDKYPHNIINYGSVNTNRAKSVMAQSNILLSIGNTDITQLPSKIYDYISTGIPIIHFYYDENDPAVEILNKYRNAICLPYNKETIVESIALLSEFINNKLDIVDFREIEGIYYFATPKYISELIRKELYL